jgi:enoyl-CoA hydratase/carnithine racemase
MLYSKEQLDRFHEYQFAYLLVDEREHILTLTLNRPEKKNALHPVMVHELAFALEYARRRNEIRALVLQARGDVFCAGADLKTAGGAEAGRNSSVPAPSGEVLLGELFHAVCKPCLAKVEGDVYAGGFLLLAGCHYVIAADHVQLGLPEVKRGLFPFQVMAGLLEVMPARRVLDWCMRGYNLTAQQAVEWGLVTHLTERAHIEDIARELLRDILANSPTAIRLGLEAYRYIRHKHGEAQHQYLRNMLIEILQTEDAQEGISAFREKRAPRWTGR